MKNCEIISDCIKQIYKSRGIEVFDNASTFHALIGDLAPTQTTERRILRSVIDDSLLKQLSVVFKDDESDKEYEAIRIKRIIEDNNGLSEKWSEFIIGSFTTAAGIKLNAFSAENTKLDEFKNINETKIITENEYGQEQKFILSDGCTYVGNITNGKMTGNGTMTKNGVRQSGYFENGILKSSNEQSTVSVNNSESEILKKKNILIQKKEALSKELKSLGVFDVKRKMEIRKQISSIDLELTLNLKRLKLYHFLVLENYQPLHLKIKVHIF